MDIWLPHAGIVLLVGPSNSGKSTLLKQSVEKGSIKQSEVISSDACRVSVSDDEFLDWRGLPKEQADAVQDEYQTVSKEAFRLMESLVDARCRLSRLSIIDATNLHPDDRKRYIDIARKNDVPIVAVMLNTAEEELLRRDEERENPRGKRRIKQQYGTFKREKRFLKKEGYKAVYTIEPEEDILFKRRTNPIEQDIGSGIDVIGDIHGCFDELLELLRRLGYEKNTSGLYTHPEGRKFVSLGDVMSRGPKSLETMLFFYDHAEAGHAYMIDSNHGWKIARWLDGRNVTLSHGDEKVAEELIQFEREYGTAKADEVKELLKEFLLRVPSHYVFTQNGVPTLVCTHAGIKDQYIGKQSAAISDYCRYGDTDGFDESGKPIRKDWFVSHQKPSLILWGHDPKPRPLVINNTINIDQGAVFGGALTAFRYPEKKYVSVKAKQDYANVPDSPLIQWEKQRLHPPNIGQFINGYSVLTEEMGEVRVGAEVVKPAIDTVSHYTVPLEQLVYIPPTMSPTPETAAEEQYLEHPAEAIRYYRKNGIQTMIAEKKHMGSRAVLFLFKDEAAARKHTGIATLGVIYTRTGRQFFEPDREAEIVGMINENLVKSGYFTKYETDFVLLDAEIMPWNLKAKELISSHYAHVSENAILDRSKLLEKLQKAASHHEALNEWQQEYTEKLDHAHTFKEVFQKYCWDVESVGSIQIAPFHVLAHSSRTFFDEPHTWHMEMNHEFAGMSDLFVETAFKVITDEASEQGVIEWWQQMTEDGHEGIVIKPETYVARHKGKLLQPAIKVRGRKYLHIIYGMDYTDPENLKRLKNRSAGKKQKLALKEFSLGLEGIQRFVNGESIERVHECALAVLALESDPVDPRL